MCSSYSDNIMQHLSLTETKASCAIGMFDLHLITASTRYLLLA